MGAQWVEGGGLFESRIEGMQGERNSICNTLIALGFSLLLYGCFYRVNDRSILSFRFTHAAAMESQKGAIYSKVPVYVYVCVYIYTCLYIVYGEQKTFLQGMHGKKKEASKGKGKECMGRRCTHIHCVQV